MTTTIAIGYARCSTREQAHSGLGLDAQRETIRSACRQRDWDLVDVYVDAGMSGGSLEARDGLDDALQALRDSPGTVLVAAKVDRLARSVPDFAQILRRVQDADGALVALDLGVDTSTPAGKMLAQVVAVFAEFERDVGSARTRDALRAKRARGERLGPKPADDPHAVALIREERGRGTGWRAVARALTAAGIPPPGHASRTGRVGRAGVWRHSTVTAMASRLGID